MPRIPVNRLPAPREASASPGRDAPGLGLLRPFGIEVRLDWSLLIIFALVTFSLGAGVLPRWHPDWTPLGTWSLALAASVLFFASLLAHELGHALVARAVGIPIKRVTLHLLGGVAQLERQPPTARAEFAMAAVGPLVSFAIGALAIAAGIWLAGADLALGSLGTREDAYRALARLGPAATLLLWLGPINVMLGLFNLVPGFPLDGGRLLRAVLWGLSGDLVRATRWASRMGLLVAWGMMGVGVVVLFGGALVQGLWLMLLGWFLSQAAHGSYQQLVVQQSLEQVPVTRVMRTRLDSVGPMLSLDELVRDHVMATDQHAFPVEDGGQLVGLVTLDDVRRVPQREWAQTPVREAMTPADQLSTLPPEAGAEEALQELAAREVEQIPIVDHGSLLGLVRRQDLVRWLSLQHPPGAGPLSV